MNNLYIKYDFDIKLYVDDFISQLKLIFKNLIITNNSQYILNIEYKKRVKSWKCEDYQVFELKYISNNEFKIFAESNIGVFYALNELINLYGTTHTLTYDYPIKHELFYFPRINKLFKPKQVIREYRVVSDFLTGGEGRSLREQKELIKHLARLKNNSIKIDLWLFPPFLSYSCIDPSTKKIIQKKGGYLHCYQQFEVRKDSIASRFTKITNWYTNPDFANCHSDEELSLCAEHYINEIISTAKLYDMRVEIQFNPFDYPANFACMLDNPVIVNQIGQPQVCEGKNVCGEKSLLMIKLLFDTVLSKYPNCDVLNVTLPEIAREANDFDTALEYLNNKFKLSTMFDLNKILGYQEIMKLYPGGFDRSFNEIRMNLELLVALYKMLDVSGLKEKIFQSGKTLAVIMGGVSNHALPLYAACMDDGFELYNSCYTCDHVEKSLPYYQDYNFSNSNVMQVLTLEDDNLGGIYQSQLPALSNVLSFNISHNIKKYSLRFWPIKDLDEMSAAISYASWNDCSVYDSYINIIKRLYGINSIELLKCFNLIEETCKKLNFTDLGILFQINGNFANYVYSDKITLSDNVKEAIISYKNAFNILNNIKLEIYDDDIRKRILYLKERFNLSYGLLYGLELICNANKTRSKNDYIIALDFIKSKLLSFSTVLTDDNDLAHLVVYEHLFINEISDKIFNNKDM